MSAAGATARFQLLPGVGPTVARRLVEQGARRVSDLRRAATYATLPRATRAALDYPPCRAIPLEAARAIAAELARAVRIGGKRLVPRGGRSAAVGSVRRSEATSGDVDVLVESAAAWEGPLSIAAGGAGTLHLVREISGGPRQRMIVVWVPGLEPASCPMRPARGRRAYRAQPSDWPDFLPPAGSKKRARPALEPLPSYIQKTPGRYVRVDLFRAAPAEWPFALLHYTNGEQYEKKLRAHAKREGLFLNAAGLFRRTASGKPGARLPAPRGGWTEKTVIERVGLTYRPAAQRAASVARSRSGV